MVRLPTVQAVWALITICCAAICAGADDDDARSAKPLQDELPRIAAKEPTDALKTFRLLHGFQMQLLAHEPIVTDPVAAEYDENGRLYVVEMRGYPYQKEHGTPAIGRVRVLVDRDGDGVFDHSEVFVDGLSWATGIAHWKGGVYVCAAPDIWYLKDTDGDLKADVKKKVFSGFGVRNVQALPNNLKWGIDHKIYGATAANGGTIRHEEQPRAKAISVRGRDFRFDPSTGAFEAISGTAQFGNSFDDWYNRFVCSNSNHAQQVVLPSRYLARNPYLPVPAVIKSIAKEGGASPVFRASSAEPWRVVRTRRRAASGKRYAATELVPIGFFTSATGITVYRGTAYPKEFNGNLFIGDVGGNLIHRKFVTPQGPVIEASRADEKAEFLTSSDNWFRPVNFVNAPDGTLHVLDMYRETIEHPWSIPDDIKAFLDLESGRDRGRIYRLAPPGFTLPPPPRLGKASTAELVKQLANPNSWWRETAHRLLWERQDPTAFGPLRKLLRECTLPQGRLHVLWSLNGLGALRDADIAAGLNDPSPRIREAAVQLAEERLDESLPLLEKVLSLAADADTRVRFQVAFSLGEVRKNAERATPGLARIARSDAVDPWMRTAVLSSSVACAASLTEELIADRTFVASRGGAAMLNQLAVVVGGRKDADEVGRVLTALESHGHLDAYPNVRQGIVLALGDGLARSRASLTSYLRSGETSTARMLRRLLDTAVERAADADKSLNVREQAIRMLTYAEFGRVKPVLAGMLDSRQPAQLQLAAIRALSSFTQESIANILLDAWPAYTPPVRGEAVEVLLSRRERIGALLDAVEAGTIPPGQLAPARRELLMQHKDAAIRDRAVALFGKDAPSPRAEVIAAYQSALAIEGQAARGQKVFERECVTCHRVGNKGHQVGPDLATIRNRTPDALMTQILDPNREVLPNYIDYVVVLDDGRLVTGIIAAESPTSITLKRAENNSDTILRQNIEEMRATGKSLMPEGLEKKISPQEIADLLTFLLGLQ